MKISDFVGQISNGLARSNRFIVNLTPPSVMTNALRGQGESTSSYTGFQEVTNVNSASSYGKLQNILLLCDSAQLPGVSLTTAQIRTFGEIREIPYEIDYEPITLTFFVDAEMNVKKMFDLWMMSTQFKETRKFSYYDSYTTTMTIYVQDMEENNRYIVELYEAYPKTVSAVQVDYSNKDVMKLSVTMMYKYWRSKQVVYNNTQSEAKPEFFDYTTSNSLEDYNNNFTEFQQRYNDQYGSPESIGNSTGDVVTYI